MLDGRVLEASQVEYKPFGKPPLQREPNEYGLAQNGLAQPRFLDIGGTNVTKIPVLPWGEDCSTLFFFANGCEAPAARPRLPGIASSLHTEVGITTSLFCRKTHHRASAEGPGDMLSSQHNSRSVFFPSPGQRRRSVSDAVLAVSLTECFFTTHTPCRQSCCGNRIALVNPGVATGLPLQSCCGNRIASPNPALTTGMPRCITSSSGLELFFPERRLVMESAPL